MKSVSWIGLTLLGVLATQPGTARAADLANGKALGQRLCVNCHIVVQGEAGGRVTAGIPAFKDIANKPNQTARNIQDRMLNPHPPMPEVQLTNNERADLAAYILSLKD
jgi:mono/diheme cytochrome c family protein